ncbi:rhamnan synthesis F family protein [Mesorhizobium sp. ArgA1]
MSINAAIVAHFDPNGRFEDNFVELIACLRTEFCRVIVVTTSEIGVVKEIPGVEVVRRPNIGYDFYSYKVGLNKLLSCERIDRIALVNSSIILLNEDAFGSALHEMLSMCGSYDAVGATSSLQFGWHMQSYLMIFGKSVLKSKWFQSFIEDINPLNSKMDMIFKYEIGLSVELVRNHARVATLFNPASRADKNWTHVAAGAIARQLGFVKMEVLRDNPHGIDLQAIREVVSEERMKQVEQMVERARGHYQIGPDNLVTLRGKDVSPLPVMKKVRWKLPRRKGVSTAVVIHLYYIETIEEIKKYIENIILPTDIFVTTPFEADVVPIVNEFSKLGASVSVYVTENRGRDIGPFVALYRSGELDGYAAVLKVHSKKSTYSDQGNLWRGILFRSLAGDSLTVLRAIELLKSGEVGIVGPHAYYLTDLKYWGADRNLVRHLLLGMGLLEAEDEPELGFFAGSMFWFRPDALRPLQAIDEEMLRFEPESGKQDGTLAHAIERVFCAMVRSVGYRATSVALKGREIHDTETEKNGVPVL